MDQPWLAFIAAGAAGLGLGVGLLIGAYAVRGLRHLIRDERRDDGDES